LGNGAATGNVVNTSNAVIAGATYTFAGTSATGTVSVGAAGFERTITNVAAGQLNANSTDAVNGSQLYATDVTLNNLSTPFNNINSPGSSTPIKSFHVSSTLADSSATGTDSIAVGPAALASASNSIAIGNGATASIANSVALGNGATTSQVVATLGIP